MGMAFFSERRGIEPSVLGVTSLPGAPEAARFRRRGGGSGARRCPRGADETEASEEVLQTTCQNNPFESSVSKHGFRWICCTRQRGETGPRRRGGHEPWQRGKSGSWRCG